MRFPVSLAATILPVVLWGAACSPVNTVPAPVSPTAAVQYHELEVPSDLEIKSVDFAATTFSEVSGSANLTATSVGGRAFVKVYAVQRTTGEQFLLLYEDIEHRKQPVQIVRFSRGPALARPDSTPR